MDVNGRPAYLGQGSEERLVRSFLEEGLFTLLAFRPDGTIIYCNEVARSLAGYAPADLIGTNVVDLLHPEDVERALLALSSGDGLAGVVTGLTRFRVKRADGEWQPIEIFGGTLTDGAEEVIGIYARSGLHEVVVEDILAMLLQSTPTPDVLGLVCNVIQWHGAGSHLAISWHDGDGIHQVSTGIPDALGGGDGRDGTPWSAMRRGGRLVALEGGVPDVPSDIAEIARQHHLELFWVEPVAWSDIYEPALVTVWSAGGSRTPRLHSYGMSVAKNMVELILRWTEQFADLSRAATVDALTGVLNRRAFAAALEDQASGALLYCDLDRFKPVNDSYGHAAGDALLRLVARRIEACVREDDAIGRLGGDEFAVVCVGATATDAREVAERIREVVDEPFDIDGTSIHVSVSIGVCATPGALDWDVLAAADQALFEAKAAGRSRVRIAESVTPAST